MHVLTMGWKSTVNQEIKPLLRTKANWKCQGINRKELTLQVGGRVISAEHRPLYHTDSSQTCIVKLTIGGNTSGCRRIPLFP